MRNISSCQMPRPMRLRKSDAWLTALGSMGQIKYACKTNLHNVVYYRVMMRENPSTHCPHEPATPAMLYPRGGINVCLFARKVNEPILQWHSSDGESIAIAVKLTQIHLWGSRKPLTACPSLSGSLYHQSRAQLANRSPTKSLLAVYLWVSMVSMCEEIGMCQGDVPNMNSLPSG